MSPCELIILLGTLMYVLYKYGTEFYDHWDRKGINYLKPSFPFIGNSRDLILKKISAAENLIKVYNEFKGQRFGGVFMLRRPILLLRDPEIVKNVMVKDFEHFFNRALLIDPDADPLFGKNLSVLKVILKVTMVQLAMGDRTIAYNYKIVKFVKRKSIQFKTDENTLYLILLRVSPQGSQKLCNNDVNMTNKQVIKIKRWKKHDLMVPKSSKVAYQQWKNMRNTLTPMFTTAKMKNMLTLINAIGHQMTDYLDGLMEEQLRSQHRDKDLLTLEFKDFFRRFTIDVIASCAFGVEIDSLKDRENQFYKMGVKVVNLTGIVFVKYILCFMFPTLVKALKMTVFGKEERKFYTELIQKSIKLRKEKNIIRPDLIYLFMQSRDENRAAPDSRKTIEVTDDEIAAQAVVFFLAGFETVATSLSFTAYELAVNPDFQSLVQEEIDRVVGEEGSITYEGVMHKMKYLDMVISESLRKWPPTILTNRTVTKRYVIPKTSANPELILEKGDDIWIPIIAFHRNPEFFPNPEFFDPERFNEKNKEKIIPFSYFPFGTGPRGCIGNRFGIMELKTCMVHLLLRYTFKIVPKTQVPLKLSRTNQSLTAEKGFWLGLKPRN